MSEAKSETILKKGLIFNKTLYYALELSVKSVICKVACNRICKYSGIEV